MTHNHCNFKTRSLHIGGIPDWSVCNSCAILNPGKFEGEMPHAVRDYSSTPDEVTEGAWRVGHRYYREDDQGFVHEINKHQYELIVQENTPPEECPPGCTHADYRICAEMAKEVPF